MGDRFTKGGPDQEKTLWQRLWGTLGTFLLPPPGREEVKPASPKKQEGSLHVAVTPFGVLKLHSGTHSLSLDATLPPPSLPASQSPPIPCSSSNAQKTICLVSEPLLFP